MTLLQKYRLLRKIIISCIVFNFLLIIVLFFHLNRRPIYNIKYNRPVVSTPVFDNNNIITNFPHISFKDNSSTNILNSGDTNNSASDVLESSIITRSIKYNYAIVSGVPVIYFESNIKYKQGDLLEDGEIIYISPRFLDIKSLDGVRYRWINANSSNTGSSLTGGITGSIGKISISEDK